MKSKSLETFELNFEIIEALTALRYFHPTPVQEEVVPLALENKDIIVESQIGERVIIVTGCINALVSRVSGTLIKNNSCIA